MPVKLIMANPSSGVGKLVFSTNYKNLFLLMCSTNYFFNNFEAEFSQVGWKLMLFLRNSCASELSSARRTWARPKRSGRWNHFLGTGERWWYDPHSLDWHDYWTPQGKILHFKHPINFTKIVSSFTYYTIWVHFVQHFSADIVIIFITCLLNLQKWI